MIFSLNISMCYNFNGHISAVSRWSDDMCTYNLKLKLKRYDEVDINKVKLK